jgi:hypothetical protein
MPLGVQAEPGITRALLVVFQPYELEELAAERLKTNVTVWRPVFGGVHDYFREIVKRLNQRDLLPDLVVAALVERPKDVGLVAIGETMGVTASGRVFAADGQLAIGANLEKAVRDVEQRVDIARLRERLGQGEQQTASVEANGAGFGTAFLVGPDRVITNWHVAELIHSGEVSPCSVRIRFDWKRVADGSKTFVGVRVGLSSTNWLLSGRKYADFDVEPPVQRDPLKTELDYAILSLERPIGNEEMAEPVIGKGAKREWYDLSTCADPPPKGEPIFVLGHPASEPLTISMGRVLEHAGAGRRIRHDAWSVAGSSGSPVLNADGLLVGLHHGTEPRSGKKARYNQAIPMSLIAQDVDGGGSDFG